MIHEIMAQSDEDDLFFYEKRFIAKHLSADLLIFISNY